jgi:hypothetical protein
LRGSTDAFISKLNAAGSALTYSTYLGGTVDAFGSGIAVDAAGNAYVTGYTASSDFPTTSGAFQATFDGGLSDAFVSKLNAAGSALLYSTYLGRSGQDEGDGIAIDSSGNAYVIGITVSSNFPTTPGAFQTAFGGGTVDAFVTKLNGVGSALAYSSYLGGSSTDLGLRHCGRCFGQRLCHRDNVFFELSHHTRRFADHSRRGRGCLCHQAERRRCGFVLHLPGRK